MVDIIEKIKWAVNAAKEKKARDVVIIDLRDLTVFADYFILSTGDNPPQIKAIVETIVQHLKKQWIRPLHIEGFTHKHWVLMDYNDIIIHIFDEETRQHYDLEKLWIDAPRIDIEMLK